MSSMDSRSSVRCQYGSSSLRQRRKSPSFVHIRHGKFDQWDNTFASRMSSWAKPARSILTGELEAGIDVVLAGLAGGIAASLIDRSPFSETFKSGSAGLRDGKSRLGGSVILFTRALM